MIFVFGSNLAGHHGGGAAYEALVNFEAQDGMGEGAMGRSYAIPTMDENIKPLALDEIEGHVEKFKEFARNHEHLEFFVTAIGCGIAGYTPEQIAPMFKDAPMNCTLHRRFVEALK